MKRVKFFCELPAKTVREIKRRAKAADKSQWQVVDDAINPWRGFTQFRPMVRPKPLNKNRRDGYKQIPTIQLFNGGGTGATAASVVRPKFRRNNKHRQIAALCPRLPLFSGPGVSGSDKIPDSVLARALGNKRVKARRNGKYKRGIGA